jgi:heme/copper-type cytochrome/quinol oxidase subunit 2
MFIGGVINNSLKMVNIVELKTFNVFPEYFIGISALYILVVVVLISYNVYGLITQKALSECVGLSLLFAHYSNFLFELETIHIVILVSWLIFSVFRNFIEFDKSDVATFVQSNSVEIVWTTIDALILLSLASLLFSLLHNND